MAALKLIIALCVLLILLYALLRRLGRVRFITYPKHSAVPAMPWDEVQRVAHASVGKRVRLVFTDALAESVDIVCVDDEGFVYSGPEPSEYARNWELVNRNPAQYWTRFQAVASIEPSA